MSQPTAAQLDPASHAGDARAQYTELRTQHVPAGERLDFWREVALRWMNPRSGPSDGSPFGGRLRRVALGGGVLIEHASEAIVAHRTAAQCRRDAKDEICIDVMVDCSSAWMEHGTGQRIGRGTISVVDFARPSEVRRSRHHATGVILPRAWVRAAIGDGVDRLAGRRLSPTGIGVLLRSHLRAVLEQAPRLSAEQRAVAATAAFAMALAALQAETPGTVEAEPIAVGIYAAGRLFIVQNCSDAELGPDRVAARLGCSRASLYRAFARHGASVAATIWAARLERAWTLLTAPEQWRVPVSDIAFRSGFVEQPSFNRMFRKRYGMTPREARGGLQERAAAD